MREFSSKEKLIIDEWKMRHEQYEQSKKELKDVLGKYGAASREFNAARVEFEMLKEEFDNFERENQRVLSDFK